MSVVAIIGILVAIAFPSYQTHLRKGRRAEAQSFMLEAANRQQQYLMDARAYALGSGSTFLTTLSLTPATSVTNFYALTVTPAAATTPPSFTIVATPIAGTPQEPDGILTLDNTGAKTRSGNAGW